MAYPEELYYTKDHEWLRVEGDEGTIGITEFASDALGDVVYVELPDVGEKFQQGKPFGSVESVKSVNELFIPISGEIVAINSELVDAPELVNNAPYGQGWMIRVKIGSKTEIDALLTSSEYEDFVAEQSE
ncbi:MAG: glycine cleavage system protein GcvH [Acidobacteria bacterium]|nr:glycine cleavage system protein GcvH [Acidobacteriota bacterium]MCW5967407.1 glycine cleavage system protein GcvH [Blastocatellales bacterium]